MADSIIFDMDGTLFQTDKILGISLEDTFNHLRTLHKWSETTPIDKYREIMGVPLPEVWKALLPNHSIQDRERTDAFFLERLIENIHEGNGALYPHVEETFSYLTDHGFSIYIASNGLAEYLHAIVGYYKLDRWVTETCSIQQIKTLNKTDLVRSIKEKYGITDGAVVGDRLSDIKAAKDNNLLSIGCNFDFAQDDELSQADIVIEDLLELQTIQTRLNM